MRTQGNKLDALLSVAVLAAAALLAVAGCGGEASSPNSTGSLLETPGQHDSSITKTELISRGDAICRKTDGIQTAELRAYRKRHPDGQSTRAATEKAISEVGLPPVRAEVAKLAGLGAPKGDEVEVSAIVRGMEGALEAVEEDPGKAIGSAADPFAGVDKLAADYGFKACSHAL